ncbi:sunset domain-containing protein [Mesorhizobium koreense]|uniref:sunset domain-containing protein n=1 Tax=Mesorhizobium koreense TaxID=3074855 RepID=UPI00287B7E40|nr:hypothetical protein [Mesorhizobium sp. WR6]
MIAACYSQRMKISSIPLPAAILVAAGVGYYSTDLFAFSRQAAHVSQPRPASQVSQSCDIKGNISINTGEHIYHVRGQKYYAVTRISPQYGERWFCSEAEARAAGWRKARE